MFRGARSTFTGIYIKHPMLTHQTASTGPRCGGHAFGQCRPLHDSDLCCRCFNNSERLQAAATHILLNDINYKSRRTNDKPHTQTKTRKQTANHTQQVMHQMARKANYTVSSNQPTSISPNSTKHQFKTSALINNKQQLPPQPPKATTSTTARALATMIAMSSERQTADINNGSKNIKHHHHQQQH